MSATDWKYLGLFAGGTVLVSMWSPRAAWVMVGTMALVALFTHTSDVLSFVGASAPKG